jgi:hypothetical protein
VVAFGVGHPEEPLFEKGVPSVPQRERDADVLMTIAHPEEAIFVPAVGTGPRVVMGKMFPRRCVTAVVFADRTPCAFGEVPAHRFQCLTRRRDSSRRHPSAVMRTSDTE